MCRMLLSVIFQALQQKHYPAHDITCCDMIYMLYRPCHNQKFMNRHKDQTHSNEIMKNGPSKNDFAQKASCC